MKTYTIQIKLEEKEHDLLLQKQELRKSNKLPRLSLEKLIKLYMLEGMLGRHFLEQQEGICQ